MEPGNSLPRNRGMRDSKLVNGHVYRRTDPRPRRKVHASAYVFSVHIRRGRKESRRTRYRSGSGAFLPGDGRELSFVINTNGGANSGIAVFQEYNL